MAQMKVYDRWKCPKCGEERTVTHDRFMRLSRGAVPGECRKCRGLEAVDWEAPVQVICPTCKVPRTVTRRTERLIEVGKYNLVCSSCVRKEKAAARNATASP